MKRPKFEQLPPSSEIEYDLNTQRMAEAARETLDDLMDELQIDVGLNKGDFAGTDEDYAMNFIRSQMELAASAMAQNERQFSKTQIKELLEQQINNPFTRSLFTEKINTVLAGQFEHVVQGYVAAAERVKSVEQIDERCKAIREIAAEREYPLAFVDQELEHYRQSWIEDFQSESNLIAIIEEELNDSSEKLESLENILDQTDLVQLLELGAQVRESSVYEDISQFAQSAFEALYIQKAHQRLEDISKNLRAYISELKILQRKLQYLREDYFREKKEKKGPERERLVKDYQEQVRPLYQQRQILRQQIEQLTDLIHEPEKLHELYISTLDAYGDSQAEQTWQKFIKQYEEPARRRGSRDEFYSRNRAA